MRVKYLDLSVEQKKSMESDGDSNYNWGSRNDPQRLRKKAGRVRQQMINRLPQNYSITNIGRNNEKSTDLRNQLSLRLQWKTIN